jgi:signal transduction histidine kinase
LWYCAYVLNRTDAKRQKTLDSLQVANRELHKVNSALKAKIAEQIQTEEARHKTELQLFQSQKMEAMGTLASGIAHDFNNFLTIIQLNAESALEAAPDIPLLQSSLREIRKSGGRAADVVRQIMTFGRTSPVERKPVHPGEIVADALEMLRHSLPSRVKIHTEIPAGLLPVLADATQIQQVMLNLGTNAMHAMADSGGVLEVRMENAVIVRPQVRGAEAPGTANLNEGHYVHITVHDTGHGMDEETRKRIFDPFFTTKPPGKGTGLGLSVAHGIMRLHGGSIGVSSEPGQGSVFHLYIPADHAH